MSTKIDRPLITRASLSEQAYAAIKQMILDLELQPGQVITEAELSARLKISKSPVRSAFIHLQRDGLITMTPYTETIVARLDARHVGQLYDVRTLIEPHVVRAVTPGLGRQDIDALAAILERADRALETEDYPAFFSTNTDFHGYFIHQYGNRFIQTTFQVVDYQMHRIRMLSATIRHHPQKQMDEHRRIFDAVHAGKAEEAAEAMRLHIAGYFDDLSAEIAAGRAPWFATSDSTSVPVEGA